MDKAIRKLGLFLMVLFCALFAQLNYIQMFRAEKLNTDTDNSRPIDQAFNQSRGTVTTADGVILARSVAIDTKKKFQREFPEKDRYAQLTGYFNYSFGATGIESAYNSELVGSTPEQQIRTFEDLWSERDKSGNLKLTVRSDIQNKAIETLGDRQGSVVAIDPTTGGVLALWSWPSFDPNLLSTHDQEKADAAKELLEAAEGKPALARAYRETYAPGSTFKVVTAATGVETGKVTPDTPTYPVERSFLPPQTQRALPNFGGSACGGTLFTILAKSCNTSFARMGIEIGGPDMIAGAEKFGFNEKPPFDLGSVVSSFPDIDYKDQQPFLAQSAIGQKDVTASPLQMALVAGGLANDGKIMTPHVVDQVIDQDNQVIRTIEPTVWKTAVSPETAATIKEAMRKVVNEGSANRLQIAGLDVGAKTGTAQTGRNTSHAWIIAWATRPGETKPFIAVAAVVLNQSGVGEGTGGRTAAPIARAIIEQALQPMPAPPTAPPPTTVPTTVAGATTTTDGN